MAHEPPACLCVPTASRGLPGTLVSRRADGVPPHLLQPGASGWDPAGASATAQAHPGQPPQRRPRRIDRPGRVPVRAAPRVAAAAARPAAGALRRHPGHPREGRRALRDGPVEDHGPGDRGGRAPARRRRPRHLPRGHQRVAARSRHPPARGGEDLVPPAGGGRRRRRHPGGPPLLRPRALLLPRPALPGPRDRPAGAHGRAPHRAGEGRAPDHDGRARCGVRQLPG